MLVADAIRGFYAILDREDEALAHALLSSGARVLQVRIKPKDRRAGAAEILRVASLARRICDEYGAALVVNDRLDIAVAARADGVHLGQTDLPLRDAKRADHDLFIGVSTHNLAQVQAAIAGGADYLGYGPVFATTTKENPDPTQGLEALRAAVQAAGATPVVAIGGITPAHAASLYATGVSALCAIGAVNDLGAAENIVAAGRSLGNH